MVDTGHRIAEIDVSENLESPYPTPVILPQSTLKCCSWRIFENSA
jgi:hypothetical protein